MMLVQNAVDIIAQIGGDKNSRDCYYDQNRDDDRRRRVQPGL